MWLSSLSTCLTCMKAWPQPTVQHKAETEGGWEEERRRLCFIVSSYRHFIFASDLASTW